MWWVLNPIAQKAAAMLATPNSPKRLWRCGRPLKAEPGDIRSSVGEEDHALH
jgi:hypothetical protein